MIGTANRSMNALKATLARRAFGYVIVLTVVVVALGAAGMLSFEPAGEVPGGFTSYGDALWWTAMLVATLGVGVLAEDHGGPGAVLPARDVRVRRVRLHHGELRLLLRGPRRGHGGRAGGGAKDLARLSDEVAALRAALGGPLPSVDR